MGGILVVIEMQKLDVELARGSNLKFLLAIGGGLELGAVQELVAVDLVDHLSVRDHVHPGVEKIHLLNIPLT